MGMRLRRRASRLPIRFLRAALEVPLLVSPRAASRSRSPWTHKRNGGQAEDTLLRMGQAQREPTAAERSERLTEGSGRLTEGRAAAYQRISPPCPLLPGAIARYGPRECRRPDQS